MPDDETKTPTQGTCAFCGRVCDSDFFCHGCRSFICDDCDRTDVMGFDHEVIEHAKPSAGATAGVLLVLLMLVVFVYLMLAQ